MIVEKPSDKLQICLDPKHLNQVIRRQRYKLSTVKELFSEMRKSKIFTKLDVSSGYLQIKVRGVVKTTQILDTFRHNSI